MFCPVYRRLHSPSSHCTGSVLLLRQTSPETVLELAAPVVRHAPRLCGTRSRRHDHVCAIAAWPDQKSGTCAARTPQLETPTPCVAGELTLHAQRDPYACVWRTRRVSWVRRRLATRGDIGLIAGWPRMDRHGSYVRIGRSPVVTLRSSRAARPARVWRSAAGRPALREGGYGLAGAARVLHACTRGAMGVAGA